jgi:hypothetical protein
MKAALGLKTLPNDPIHYLVEIGDRLWIADLASIVRIGRPQLLGSSFKLAIQSHPRQLGATYIGSNFLKRPQRRC